MKSGLRVAFLLLLLTGTVSAKGSDLSEAPNDNGLHREAAAQRPKRFSFFGPKEAPAKPTPGFNLADALRSDSTPPKSSGGYDSGFKLEDALRPAVGPSGGSCERVLVEKLNEILENQKLLLKPKAPLSRFYNGR